MLLTGIHFLLTYQCTLECDHCFVWGSPRQNGVMTLPQIRGVLCQARDLGTVTSVYFEGGEPFLYYATLLQAVRAAAELGFEVGIVSNGYWATSVDDARAALQPFAGLVQDLTISSDLFHAEEKMSRKVQNAFTAAGELGIPQGMIAIAQPGACETATYSGQIAGGESQVMYRGRAAEKLAPRAAGLPWEGLSACPHEDLREPGRIHVDPLGNLHLCQGISLGNVFQEPLREICARYDPQTHPIAGPLLAGGPAELVHRYHLPHAAAYADACHLCDSARRSLRPRFPQILIPDQMYAGG